MTLPSRFLLMGCVPDDSALTYDLALRSDGAVRWPLAHDGAYVCYTRVPPAAATGEESSG